MKRQFTATELIKYISELEKKREAILDKSDKMSVFQCASTENAEELRPEYDFDSTLAEIDDVNSEIIRCKHALNKFNISTAVGDTNYTIDEMLVILPQLNHLKSKLYDMSMRMKKERIVDRYSSSSIIDYNIANYDIENAAEKYQKLNETLARYQLELDKVNMNGIVEVDI